ncbi:unnamed protein product [Cuscuta epithymum]|uniref:Protein kinase domain-containing protein n=1 Tax=Cuscuta epithymum TaxID=186058 RepID=A0AAV0DBD5_9ASTE|nr:unnamed protein product [Cuscuta epithymum]
MAEQEAPQQFLTELEALRYEPYYYQEDNILKSPYMPNPALYKYLNLDPLFKQFRTNAESFREINKIAGRDLDNVKYYDFPMLNEITNGFKRENFIVNTLFGSLYRGTIVQQGSRNRQVLVKTWDFYRTHSGVGNAYYAVYPSTFYAEMKLLFQKELGGHDNFVNMIGYCLEKKLAVVYDGKANKVLSQLLKSDNFDWDERMKVALQLAKFLEWLHAKHIILGAISADSILVDEVEYNVAFFELGLTRCVLDSRKGEATGDLKMSYAQFAAAEDESDTWTCKSDVFAYGSVLSLLIRKEYYGNGNYSSASEFALQDFKNNHILVNGDFQVNDADAYKITELTLKCLELDPNNRVDMGHVVYVLEQLALDHIAKKQKLN